MMKLNFLCSFLVFLLLLFSCKSKNEKIIDENALIPKSDNSDKTVESVKKVLYSDTLPAQFLFLTDSLGFKTDSTKAPRIPAYLARFGAETQYEVTTFTGKDSLKYGYFYFKDSVKTKTSFYNWLDCFGNRCTTVRLGEELKVAPTYLTCLISTNEIHYFEGTKLVDLKQLLLKSQFKKRVWNVALQHIPNGKLKWNSIDKKGKLTPIKQIQNETLAIPE